MKDFITKLTEKTSEFGNHYRKYWQAVSNNLSPLIQKLEENKRRDAVHVLHPAYDFGTELSIVANISNDQKEKMRFIGTYFALQFLLINRQAIDLLRMDVMGSGADRLAVYRKFMIEAGNNFRLLTANYIKELLNIFIDQKDCPEFVIMGVGTKSDQDDIDVGIIDTSKGDRSSFNRAIARISQEMLKFAISFHFHLSEHIGDNYYSASISEYKKALKNEIKDFVIISEMLGAAVIIGSERLFRKYKKDVIDRYFYHQNGNNLYHEGFLRGIIGEVYSLLARPIGATLIHFKEDSLRAIKSIICAQKTRFNIDRTNTWETIDMLKIFDAKRNYAYDALERSLTFFEIFRYLYQLFVTQDEQIILDSNAFKNIRRVAKVLGYRDMGKCRTEEHLLMHYYEHIQNIRRIIPVLVGDIKEHLHSTSTFAPLMKPDYTGNIAEDFIQKFKFFRGTSFWNDILDVFKTENFVNRFVNDINALTTKKRRNVIRQYIESFKYDFYSLINLVTIFGSNKNSFSIFREFNNYVLQNIEHIPSIIRNLAYVFNNFPSLINRYLALNNEKVLNYYLRILERKIFEKDIANIIDELKGLIRIHLAASQFFKRFFMRILDKYPDAIKLLKNPGYLQEFADGIYSDINSMPTFTSRKEKLGDYYDFEMMRVGIKTLSGASVEVTNAEFTEFSDKYMLTLFDLCRRDVDIQYKKRIITDDVLAVFAAGGHAREQAYDDDYDIIVLLNSDDPEIATYCNRIVSKMNNEIIKRGTIPHHRFTDYFGRFVIQLQEVENLLAQDRDEVFIEKSQILGARLIIGSHRFENEFLQKIVRPHIFERKNEYIAQMKGEIVSRHNSDDDKIMEIKRDIKEGIGGLRDIEMMMLIIKANFEISEPFNSHLFSTVAEQQKELASDLRRLARAFSFLKNLRDVYRLTSGASDIIMPEALKTAAQIMGYTDKDRLFASFQKVKKQVKNIIGSLLKKLS